MPKFRPELDPKALAEQTCIALDDDVGGCVHGVLRLNLGHLRTDLLDILLKHPALEGQKECLASHFSQAQGDPNIETATLYVARRMILLATKKAEDEKGVSPALSHL